MRVLVNAFNLMVGGGDQVASSFLDELALLVEDHAAVARFSWLQDGLTVQASTKVLKNTPGGTADALIVREHTATFYPGVRLGPLYDVSFSVFGPEYVPFRSRHPQIDTEAPHLTDPTDSGAMAQPLVQALAEGPGPKTERGEKVACEWPTARERALHYVEPIGAQAIRSTRVTSTRRPTRTTLDISHNVIATPCEKPADSPPEAKEGRLVRITINAGRCQTPTTSRLPTDRSLPCAGARRVRRRAPSRTIPLYSKSPRPAVNFGVSRHSSHKATF